MLKIFMCLKFKLNWMLFFFNIFIWVHQVLVVACEIFRCGTGVSLVAASF